MDICAPQTHETEEHDAEGDSNHVWQSISDTEESDYVTRCTAELFLRHSRSALIALTHSFPSWYFLYKEQPESIMREELIREDAIYLRAMRRQPLFPETLAAQFGSSVSESASNCVPEQFVRRMGNLALVCSSRLIWVQILLAGLDGNAWSLYLMSEIVRLYDLDDLADDLHEEFVKLVNIRCQDSSASSYTKGILQYTIGSYNEAESYFKQLLSEVNNMSPESHQVERELCEYYIWRMKQNKMPNSTPPPGKSTFAKLHKAKLISTQNPEKALKLFVDVGTRGNADGFLSASLMSSDIGKRLDFTIKSVRGGLPSAAVFFVKSRAKEEGTSWQFEDLCAACEPYLDRHLKAYLKFLILAAKDAPEKELHDAADKADLYAWSYLVDCGLRNEQDYLNIQAELTRHAEMLLHVSSVWKGTQY